MSSVTARINEIKQPRGGYIKPSQFVLKQLNDNNRMNDVENIHATIIGIVVDYLTRYIMGTELIDVFNISCHGAILAKKMGYKNAVKAAKKYFSNIDGLDNESIINACKLATFDAWFRNPIGAMIAKTAEETNPDFDTIENIKIMIKRSISFWKKYGPIMKERFTFEEKGYTETVNTGDGDFLTEDTLWDFKVSKNNITNKHTLQILMYWIMGQHSGKSELKKNLGIFNPRLNVVYTLDVENISPNIIKMIENEVICY